MSIIKTNQIFGKADLKVHTIAKFNHTVTEVMKEVTFF